MTLNKNIVLFEEILKYFKISRVKNFALMASSLKFFSKKEQK